ncbi:MAG: heme-copper oxidase subunit III [Opitutales bacterium]|nr:heme-copper oxidase subunit III [Opitutales bacterium]|tara:strand:+ start:4992 stop:5588 length:597 start_codon:yes stop_codon:yes gene_type:complete
MKTLEPTYGGHNRPEREPRISNSALGMVAFIGTELMFFAALISAFLIISSAAEAWPPEGQPRLPIYVTALNSLVLFASGWMMFKAYHSFKATSFSEETSKLVRITMWLGIVFVAVQGIEWIRLLSYGLTMTSSQYGAFFYLIIGTHAVHAIGAVIGLRRLSLKLEKGTLRLETFQAVQLFWFFVVGVWPILYVLVYLS